MFILLLDKRRNLSIRNSIIIIIIGAIASFYLFILGVPLESIIQLIIGCAVLVFLFWLCVVVIRDISNSIIEETILRFIALFVLISVIGILLRYLLNLV